MNIYGAHKHQPPRATKEVCSIPGVSISSFLPLSPSISARISAETDSFRTTLAGTVWWLLACLVVKRSDSEEHTRRADARSFRKANIFIIKLKQTLDCAGGLFNGRREQVVLRRSLGQGTRMHDNRRESNRGWHS